MNSFRYLFLVLVLITAATINDYQPAWGLERLQTGEMRGITAQEGIDIQFNLSLGSAGDPMALSIQDGDGDEGTTTDHAFVGVEGLYLDLGVTGSDDITLDIFQNSDEASFGLSMEDGESITGIQGNVDRIQMKNNIRGCCGNEVVGLDLGDGNGNPGSLNFDGSLHIFDPN